MRKTLIALVPIAALALPAAAYAQGQGTVTGAAGGAVTGAIVGGPVGAAVGGIIGAIAGTALAPPPPEVQTWVVEQQRPSVALGGQVVVGEPLPGEIVLYPVDPATQYQFAIVNDRHVIVDPNNRRVLAIID